MKNILTIQITDSQYGNKCNIVYDNEYIVNSLYVRHTCRKQGIGTKLLHSAEEIILKLGGKYSYLYVHEIDKWQHDWYKRLGYIDIKVKCNRGFVKMKKKLI